MITQLLLSKRLYTCGVSYVDSPDPISAGMAISLFQDSVEIFCWSLLKELDVPIKEGCPFTSFFDLVAKAPKNVESKKLPFQAKMIELNKARVNFKHYGNLPDRSEAEKHKGYTEEFLRVSFEMFFNRDFDSISLSELVPFSDVRAAVVSAEHHLAAEDHWNCVCELAKALNMLIAMFRRFLPEVDSHLGDADRVFVTKNAGYGVGIFRYLSDYLKGFRLVTFMALSGVSLRDYSLMEQYLPHAYQTGDLRWHFRRKNTSEPTKDTILKLENSIIELSLRLNQILN
jgi:hypothetical protein